MRKVIRQDFAYPGRAKGLYDCLHAPHPPEQLTMVIAAAAVRCLADAPLPDGYVVRAYRPGDIASWAVALQRGGFDTWGEAQVMEFLEVAERREGSRLVEHDGRIVAATFASRVSNRPTMTSASGIDPSEEGVIDYVVTHPGPSWQGSRKGHLHGGVQVPRGARVQSSFAEHRRLEAAGNPPLPVDGIPAGHEQR